MRFNFFKPNNKPRAYKAGGLKFIRNSTLIMHASLIWMGYWPSNHVQSNIVSWRNWERDVKYMAKDQ